MYVTEIALFLFSQIPFPDRKRTNEMYFCFNNQIISLFNYLGNLRILQYIVNICIKSKNL